MPSTFKASLSSPVSRASAVGHLALCLGLPKSSLDNAVYSLLDTVLEYMTEQSWLAENGEGNLQWSCCVVPDGRTGGTTSPSLAQWLGNGWRSQFDGLTGLAICLGLVADTLVLNAPLHDQADEGWFVDLLEILALLSEGPSPLLSARSIPADTDQVKWPLPNSKE